MWQAGRSGLNHPPLSLSPVRGGSLIRGVVALMAQTGLAQSVGAGQEPATPSECSSPSPVANVTAKWLADPIEIRLAEALPESFKSDLIESGQKNLNGSRICRCCFSTASVSRFSSAPRSTEAASEHAYISGPALAPAVDLNWTTFA